MVILFTWNTVWFICFCSHFVVGFPLQFLLISFMHSHSVIHSFSMWDISMVPSQDYRDMSSSSPLPSFTWCLIYPFPAAQKSRHVFSYTPTFLTWEVGLWGYFYALLFSLETAASGRGDVLAVLRSCMVSTVGHSTVSAASPLHGHLGHFQYLAGAGGAAVNSLVYRYFLLLEEYCDGWVSRNGNARSKDKSKCILLASAKFHSRRCYWFTPTSTMGWEGLVPQPILFYFKNIGPSERWQMGSA